VMQWYNSTLVIDNQHLLLQPLQKQKDFSPAFINRMFNENFLSHE
jgi:hypothetical protein